MSDNEAAAILNRAERIAVLSGAGLSKASGIPTYRDAGGLWTERGTAHFSSIEEFERDPQGFHAFWVQRRREIASAKPNPGHLALAELQGFKPETTLITQNIDGLLPKTGAREVLEIHGSLARDRCPACQAVFTVNLESTDENVRHCPTCVGPRLRPDVVMFGEALDLRLSAQAEFAAKTSDVFLLVGTSAVVYPAAGWAEKAWTRGSKLIIINREPTPLDGVADVLIHDRAEVVLPQILEHMRDASTKWPLERGRVRRDR